MVKTKVQFLAACDGGTATYYASEAGVEQPKEHEGQFHFCEIDVQNGRKKEGNVWNLDKQGFKLVEHKTAVQDFRNDEEVEGTLYSEVKKILLKHVKGAKRIDIFDHTRRASTPELRKELNCREPSSMVHNDYTTKSANKRLFDMLEDAAELSKKRFAIVNLWRTMAGTILSSPLAFCDSTTVDISKELISVKRVAKDRVGELQMALHAPWHRWVYFPNMTPEEALIFKTFDSSESNDINKFTMHTALEEFEEPTAPRQSIEIRAFVFFE